MIKKKILLIDNFDSFVFNLARYVNQLGCETIVKRNNEINLHDIKMMQPSHIIISPGPKAPLDAGISLDVIRQFSAAIPILGVCLGHQAIAEAFGGKISRAKRPMHGKSSSVVHAEKKIFTGLPNPLKVGRYHSLIVSSADFPSQLEICATCEIGEIMAIQHKMYPVFGVQFHPESILTESGYHLLQNFIRY